MTLICALAALDNKSVLSSSFACCWIKGSMSSDSESVSYVGIRKSGADPAWTVLVLSWSDSSDELLETSEDFDMWWEFLVLLVSPFFAARAAFCFRLFWLPTTCERLTTLTLVRGNLSSDRFDLSVSEDSDVLSTSLVMLDLDGGVLTFLPLFLDAPWMLDFRLTMRDLIPARGTLSTDWTRSSVSEDPCVSATSRVMLVLDRGVLTVLPPFLDAPETTNFCLTPRNMFPGVGWGTSESDNTLFCGCSLPPLDLVDRVSVAFECFPLAGRVSVTQFCDNFESLSLTDSRLFLASLCWVPTGTVSPGLLLPNALLTILDLAYHSTYAYMIWKINTDRQYQVVKPSVLNVIKEMRP